MEVEIDTRFEDIAQNGLAILRLRGEEFGELALREDNSLQELLLRQTDDPLDLRRDLAGTAFNSLNGAVSLRTGGVFDDAYEARLRVPSRFIPLRHILRSPGHTVDPGRGFKDEVDLAMDPG